MDSCAQSPIAGRFRLLSVLGRGGAATVWSALDEQDGRALALKILDSPLDDRLLARFRREAEVTARLRSPHTVRLFGHGETPDGRPYLALEKLPGQSLEARLDARGALGWREAVLVAIQIARSLEEAHGIGLVHRDLKPANVFLVNSVGEAPRVKVLDFGLALITDAGATSLTETGLSVGSPAYMAPEQALGLPVDGRADLYALGALLFTMLSGLPPFVDPDPLQLLSRACGEAPPALSTVRPELDCPLALENLVRELLAKSPAERPRCATSTRARLEALLPASPAQPWYERLPGWSLPASMLLCVALAFAGLLLARPGDAPVVAQSSPAHVLPQPAVPAKPRSSVRRTLPNAASTTAREPAESPSSLAHEPAAPEPPAEPPQGAQARRARAEASAHGLLDYRAP